MAKTEFLFSQKYRPNKIADLILSEDIKETLQSFVDQKDPVSYTHLRAHET